MDANVQQALTVIANTKYDYRRAELQAALNQYVRAKAKLDLAIQNQKLENLSLDLSKAQPFDMGNRENETGAFL